MLSCSLGLNLAGLKADASRRGWTGKSDALFYLPRAISLVLMRVQAYRLR
jgi:hypothetical protein